MRSLLSRLGLSQPELRGWAMYDCPVLGALAAATFGLPDTVAAIKLSFISVGVWWVGEAQAARASVPAR